MPHSLSDLAKFLNAQKMPCRVDGPADRRITSVATLEDAGPDDISFLANIKYEKALKTTKAGAVLVSDEQDAPKHLTVLRVPDPYAAIMMVMVRVHGFRKHPPAGVDHRAVIEASVRIGDGASIRHGVTICENVVIGRNVVLYPGCYIGPGCQIGDDCVMYPNVVLYDGCVLGDRVTIHAGSVIGEDGLGYAPVGETWKKIPQIGVVHIGNDVEIGANCTIDRATLGRTAIGGGSKFSNLIAIGHGTRIGDNCMFVAQVGVAGSVTVGRNVTMAGKVGVAGHLTVGDRAQLAAMCGVMNDIPPDIKVAGQPAIPIKDAMRSISYFQRLPDMARQIKQLETQLDELRKSRDGGDE